MNSESHTSDHRPPSYYNKPQNMLNQFSLIKQLVVQRDLQPHKCHTYIQHQEQIDTIYKQIQSVIIDNTAPPSSPIKFGTSGWRGIIGDDINCHTVTIVTMAIVDMFKSFINDTELASALGVISFNEVQQRGCVLGFDSRFGNELLAVKIINVLTASGIKVYFAGESSTGALSATVLNKNAAFSINLTPSHNPLEYAGFKFNAADAGPASPVITEEITKRASQLLKDQNAPSFTPDKSLIEPVNALTCWVDTVQHGQDLHGLDYLSIIKEFTQRDDFCAVIDSVHGASRVDIANFFSSFTSKRLKFLRTNQDTTFGGIAPEPSSTNLQPVMDALSKMDYPLKLGVIMDPDADRIRFTDGTKEINMNYFGAMAYHFLHEQKLKQGMVAKTVATSNFANAIADQLGEEVYEPKVGFKEFKPVIKKALVCFEESDGITVIGHTPEKDAYIGLLLALDMTMSLNLNLGDYLTHIQDRFGEFFPDKDGIEVSQKGDALISTLSELKKYSPGTVLDVGPNRLKIINVIDIDGYKFILEDHSWLMIRPSGTEPKVRFYVEARTLQQQQDLFTVAKSILSELGLC